MSNTGDPSVMEAVRKLTDEFFEKVKIDYANGQRTRAEDALAKWIKEGRIVVIPDVEVWPDWATKIAVTYQADPGGCGDWFQVIPRPVPAWRPKYGEWVWLFRGGCRSCFIQNESGDSVKAVSGDRWAKALNLDSEKDWAWEQFVSRGETWEVTE